MGKSFPLQQPPPNFSEDTPIEDLVPKFEPPPDLLASPQRSQLETFTPTAEQVQAKRKAAEVIAASKPGGPSGTRFSSIRDPKIAGQSLKKPVASILTPESSGATTFSPLGSMGNRVNRFKSGINTVIG